MKNRYYHELMAKGKDVRFSPLQLFADGAGGSDGDSGDDGDGDGDGDDPDNGDGGKGTKRTYTDDDVDRIVERKLAEWQKKQEKAQQKQSAAQRLKEKNDQKTAEDRIQELQDQLAALQKKDAQSEMLKTARGILSEKNINAGDELVGMLISDDADETSEAVNAFADLFQAAVNRAVKDALKGETPKKKGAPGGMTKEQIMKVKNRAERQKLINENMELFK